MAKAQQHIHTTMMAAAQQMQAARAAQMGGGMPPGMGRPAESTGGADPDPADLGW